MIEGEIGGVLFFLIVSLWLKRSGQDKVNPSPGFYPYVATRAFVRYVAGILPIYRHKGSNVAANRS